ncbi:MAG: sigma-54-dependent Fis family transcriptional regulator [Bacteroidetes bacterium]|nr:sigma-54-dependent Fis family transcriptional regulator [Bacteroidota bacterium]MBS1755840.1 sigma-54-dependent Fis family transcriptional regulator [Bacteroidota bacterium]
MKKRILIIDDDIDMCTLLNRFLSRNDYEVEIAHTGNKGIIKFKENNFDIVLCDFRLGDKDGKDVLQEIKAISPSTVVIIITGYSDIKVAVDVIKMGAYDYITKPLIPEEVLNVLHKALQKDTIEDSPDIKENALPKTITKKVLNDEFLIGEAGATIDLYKQIEIVAPTNYSIILYGESGTGKEVIAKTIHSMSGRSNMPFIAMDCGTLSKELAGSELFGHVKGAFTGALTDKEGHFELANGGTLFLDEVANLTIEVQASLLRVIQERKFKRVGGNKEMPVDVRIIVASNENLQEAYRKGKFREDLYHRFNEFSIKLPPLRERKKDIPLFAAFFLEKAKNELSRNVEGFENEVMEMFINYSWPGNLREFRNVVRRAVLLTKEGKVQVNTLPWEITYSPPQAPDMNPSFINKNVFKNEYDLKDAASKAEYDAIMKVLKEVNFNKTKAAEILKIDRKTLYNKIKNYEESSN